MSLRLDFETYQEISADLLNPIVANGLDNDTLKRLYISKLVYLKNLRRQCFVDVNTKTPVFSTEDLNLITEAIGRTDEHLRYLILSAVSNALENHKRETAAPLQTPPSPSRPAS